MHVPAVFGDGIAAVETVEGKANATVEGKANTTVEGKANTENGIKAMTNRDPMLESW